MKLGTLIIALIFLFANLPGQSKFEQVPTSSDYNSRDGELILNLKDLYPNDKSMYRSYSSKTHFDVARQLKSLNTLDQESIILKDIKEDGHSVWLEILPSPKIRKLKSMEGQLFAMLEEIKSHFGLSRPAQEVKIVNIQTDERGNEHFRLVQEYRGIQVYGAELVAHTRDAYFHLINGKTYNLNNVPNKPTIDTDEAHNIVFQAADSKTIKTAQLPYIGGSQISSELIYYPDAAGKIHLAYKVDIYPDITAKWEYIVDAINGRIIHKHQNSCKFHHHRHDYNSHVDAAGPEQVEERNLFGQNININVYEENGFYYMLNVNERMFNPTLSDLPNEPVGGILTLNAKNTSPQSDEFKVDHIVSGSGRWDDPIAVTAHANATEAYKYFENTFNRLSFDNDGSTVISFINVADENGEGMDNAFWNGFALFYGNGKDAFIGPLAAAKDVAAHELAHGVIQHTANLNYQGESGALNESFADIFGVLIDRDDWTLGEDVVNRSVFQSGALRSMSDPHNGGFSLSDPGFQPKAVGEQFRGAEDNGGVHINSGIPNHAFYLFAIHPAVGLDRAEAVFYKTLRDYLSASSNFKALRRAVRQSIVDIFGEDQNILSAFQSAFDQVQIEADENDTTPPEPDITTYEYAAGEDFVLWYDRIAEEINLTAIINEVKTTISQRGLANIPSVSDDGSIILYIGDDNKMYATLINWEEGTFEERLISESREWRNVAISKDGSKIAAVAGNLAMGEFDNEVLIIDLISETQRWYTLTNPTTAQGVTTGDVRFADALEWDHTSQFLMYDASNEISSLFNDPIRYWDIGFLQAWDNESNSFGDGTIFKLFPSLPENVSIGNPTFTKFSPDIIAMDLLDGRGNSLEYKIIGVNLETSDQGLIFENNTIGYPRYSTRDDVMIFNFDGSSGDIIGITETNSDRINGTGEAIAFINDGRWGVWFNNGQRDLSTSVAEILTTQELAIVPNPVSDFFEIATDKIDCSSCTLQIINQQGMVAVEKNYSSGDRINVSQLPSGLYISLISTDNKVYGQRFVKQ